MGNFLPPVVDYDGEDEVAPKRSANKRDRSRDERGDVRIVSSGVQGRRDKMEDAVSIVTHLGNSVIGVGLFDGHSGDGAANWAKANLLYMIAATEAFSRGDLERACVDGFVAADAKMRATGIKAGTTALVVLITPSLFVVANAGDSRAVLGRAGKAMVLTMDHSPDQPGEEKRILAAGGRVVKVRGVARVLAPKLSKVLLSVSRSLGDFSLKDPKRKPADCVITPVPDVSTHRLCGPDDFLVLACDGLWEVMEPAEVIAALHKIDRPASERRSSNARPASGRFWNHIRQGSAAAAAAAAAGLNNLGSGLGVSARGRSESLDVGGGGRVRFMSEDVRADAAVQGHVPEQRARPPDAAAPVDLPFCYDGPLYSDVPRNVPRVISRLPPEHHHSLASVCDRVIDKALEYGASDNLTVAIIDLRNTIELPSPHVPRAAASELPPLQDTLAAYGGSGDGGGSMSSGLPLGGSSSGGSTVSELPSSTVSAAAAAVGGDQRPDLLPALPKFGSGRGLGLVHRVSEESSESEARSREPSRHESREPSAFST